MMFTRFWQLAFAALVTFAAEGATPIYVASASHFVGEYDSTTGAAINTNLIGIGASPTGLALLGNSLFVASPGRVGKYDATTGAPINANFITGLSEPYKLAVSGNTLFVTNNISLGTVGAYDANTGAAINANLIAGLNLPTELAVSGNSLYVVTAASIFTSGSIIGEYNATTGAPINASLIEGLFTSAMAISGNTLYVAYQASIVQNMVGEFNATTGAPINANFFNPIVYIPTGLALLGNTLFVAETFSVPGSFGNGIGRVDEVDATTGALIEADLIMGLTRPSDIALPTSASSSSLLQFVPVLPCRVFDTRNPNGTLGGPFLAAGSSRSVPIQSSPCGIPASAQAYALNMTVVPRSSSLGFLTVWPAGQSQPVVSTLNSPDGSVLANAAIVPAGTGGAINVYATDNTDLLIDINGYFAPPGGSSLQFYPLPPCRVADTRNTNGAFGGPFLTSGSSRAFTIPSSSCQVPLSAQAYSFNVTAVAHGALGYLTAWPTGQPQPVVSTLNSLDGTVLANAAIVPAGSAGSVSFYAANDTDLVLDISGYFAPPGTSPPLPGLNFYTVTPCRIADTRNPNGTFGGPILSGNTSRIFPITSSGCGLPSNASAYSLNLTVVPQGPLGYLNTWPTGQAQPGVSTLNALKGIVIANAAIVPAGTTGSIDVFAANSTHVVIDSNGYFAP